MPNSMSNKPGFYDDASSSSTSTNHQTKQHSDLSGAGSHKEPATKNAAAKSLNQRLKIKLTIINPN